MSDDVVKLEVTKLTEHIQDIKQALEKARLDLLNKANRLAALTRLSAQMTTELRTMKEGPAVDMVQYQQALGRLSRVDADIADVRLAEVALAGNIKKGEAAVRDRSQELQGMQARLPLRGRLLQFRRPGDDRA